MGRQAQQAGRGHFVLDFVQDKTKSFSDTELINKNGTCDNLEKPKAWKLHTQVNIAEIKDPDSLYPHTYLEIRCLCNFWPCFLS